MTDRRLLIAVLITLMIGSGGVVLPAAPARAGVTGNLRLVSQTPWVRPTGTFELDVAVDGPPGSRVEFTVHPRVENRISFVSSIEDGPRGIPLLVDGQDVGDQSIVSFSLSLSVAQRRERLAITESGVYPVEVSLLDIDGTRISQLTTHLVRVPQFQRDIVPLSVALTLPLETDISLRPDGSTMVSAADTSAVDAIASALRAVPDVPATVSVSPETLIAVEENRRSQLRAALDGRLVTPRPFVDLDPTAWLDAGLDSEFLDALAVGLTTTMELLDAAPSPTVWMAEPSLTPNTLATIGGIGYESIVFRDDNLQPLDTQAFPYTLTQQFLVEDSNGRRYPAGVIDTGLGIRLVSGVDPALAGYQMLSEMAVLYFDQPSLVRGVIAAPPANWTPNTGQLRIVLDGLVGNPILNPVDLEDWFTDVSTAFESGQNTGFGFVLDREIEPSPGRDLSTFAQRYTTTAANVFSFSRLFESESQIPLLDNLLLVSGADAVDPVEAENYLTAVDDRIASATRSISILDPPGHITLAAREGSVPLVLENRLDQTVNVLVSLASDKLEFPDGDNLLITVNPGVQEISVDIAARTSGDSVLDLTLSSPDRVIVLDTTRIAVRSTALSGLGLIIAGIALAFLLLWWIRTRSNRRPNQRLVLAGGDKADNVPTPPTA